MDEETMLMHQLHEAWKLLLVHGAVDIRCDNEIDTIRVLDAFDMLGGFDDTVTVKQQGRIVRLTSTTRCAR